MLDVARLYGLALEKHAAGPRYHAVGEEGVRLKEIAEVIGRGLNVPIVSISPEKASGHFGFAGMSAGAQHFRIQCDHSEAMRMEPDWPRNAC